MTLKFSSKHRVEFYDVDSMNVMWHGNYVKIIESARCEFLKNIDYDYTQMKEDGFVFPVVKMHFKYILPVFFGDIIDVETSLKDCDIFLAFEYKLFCRDKKIAQASTHQVAISIKDMQTQLSMPTRLLEAIKRKRK